MKDLLPFVERELRLFGDYFSRFRERHPGIAGDLLLNGDSGGDPGIRCLTQAAAVLNARTAKKLDDDLPELTASFLDMLAPHLLRFFPSCAVVCFDPAGGNGKRASGKTTVPRGALLKTAERKRDGVICKFVTAFAVPLAPISVTAAAFSPTTRAPAGTRLPPGVGAEIAVTIEWTPDASNPSGLPVDSLRLFIDGEPSFCAALLDALFLRTVCTYVEVSDGRWLSLGTNPLAPVGLDANEALIPFSAKSQAAFRLLTEYFCFPAKFNFLDIQLAALATRLPSGCRWLTLHFCMAGLAEDSNAARLLRSLDAQHLVAGCTPVVNLFKQSACPIRLDHTAQHYTLIADALNAKAYQVYGVNSVHMVRGAGSSAEVVEFRPYYSFHHGDAGSKKGQYWIMRRDDAVAATKPGYENQLSFVDIDFNPITSPSSTVSVELTCSNGALPSRQEFGAPGGDLSTEISIGMHSIRLLRRPTVPCAPPSGRDVQWKLASHLALSISSLSQDGLPAFREMLAMHDLVRSATSRRQIDGIVALEIEPARAWLRDKRGSATVQGVEVRMTLDEAAFVGCGIHVFAQLMDHFLGMYVHLNSFTQLTIVSLETGKELLKCPPRNGELNLV
ncbi:type VI secretion system baseplate subunit TssF [Rugamonas sp. DEMB1]|uniref:type VI secretion system baseplate subunit TssF n=1 Tax=Rugamonas sp. DEMB1 TaxID=3039386 RepID=UPI00244D0A8B|nr:type VI secretion system baseplate subunit TssF [Rugamonas sp. DEMB1]WGG53020.1 type VI secretion system baseplate subunit TssF [Rugamonas sp. DEMB1]